MMKKTKYEIKIILRESMSMMRLARSRCYDEIIGEIFFHHHQNKAAELYQFGTIINLTKMFHLSSLLFLSYAIAIRERNDDDRGH